MKTPKPEDVRQSLKLKDLKREVARRKILDSLKAEGSIPLDNLPKNDGRFCEALLKLVADKAVLVYETDGGNLLLVAAGGTVESARRVTRETTYARIFAALMGPEALPPVSPR